MKSPTILKVISFIALGSTVIPALLYFVELVDLETVQWTAFVGTTAWFLTAPLWMGRD